MEEGAGLSEIGQVALTVGDLEKAKDFYGRALGLKALFAMERMAFYHCGSLRLMLSLPEADFKPGVAGTVLYFKVDSCRETEKTLVSRGVTFEQPPPSHRPHGFLRSLDGLLPRSGWESPRHHERGGSLKRGRVRLKGI